MKIEGAVRTRPNLTHKDRSQTRTFVLLLDPSFHSTDGPSCYALQQEKQYAQRQSERSTVRFLLVELTVLDPAALGRFARRNTVDSAP